jgi:hypothetical protein
MSSRSHRAPCSIVGVAIFLKNVVRKAGDKLLTRCRRGVLSGEVAEMPSVKQMIVMPANALTGACARTINTRKDE